MASRCKCKWPYLSVFQPGSPPDFTTWKYLTDLAVTENFDLQVYSRAGAEGNRKANCAVWQHNLQIRSGAQQHVWTMSASINRPCASLIKYFSSINTLTLKLSGAASDRRVQIVTWRT